MASAGSALVLIAIASVMTYRLARPDGSAQWRLLNELHDRDVESMLITTIPSQEPHQVALDVATTRLMLRAAIDAIQESPSSEIPFHRELPIYSLVLYDGPVKSSEVACTIEFNSCPDVTPRRLEGRRFQYINGGSAIGDAIRKVVPEWFDLQRNK